jgi:hypothetical protein
MNSRLIEQFYFRFSYLQFRMSTQLKPSSHLFLSDSSRVATKNTTAYR